LSDDRQWRAGAHPTLTSGISGSGLEHPARAAELRGVGESSILSRAVKRTPPLDDAVWTIRHRWLRILLAGQAVILVALFALVPGGDAQDLAHCAVLALTLLASSWGRVPRRAQACAVALGLFTVSSGVVHLSDGQIVAHFHYFVMLPFLALYEDGLPFAAGVVYVVLQHGLMGSLAPHMVFSEQSGEGDSPWLWAGVHGAAVLAASVALRINWRAARTLRESDRRHRYRAERYFERAGTMLVDLDADGRVRAVNPAACAVLGRDRRALVGCDWFVTAMRADDVQMTRTFYGQLIRGEAPVPELFDNTVLHADGSERIVSWQCELLHDEDDAVTGMLCSGNDVTDRRRAEEALRQSQEDLEALRVLTQEVARSEDARQAVMGHVQAMTGAAWAVLAEPEDCDAGLRMTATTPGSPLLGQTIALGGAETSMVGTVFLTGEARLVADVAANDVTSTRLHALIPETRSVYYLPVEVHGGVAAVLVVGWETPVEAVTERRATLVALAGHEAGIALERRASIRRLEALAETDPLTELPNRRVWDREIPAAMARCRRSKAPLAVAALDLNEFKQLNDTQGHDAGDRLLQAAAQGWNQALRGTDLLVRFGGDEFAVLLPECDPAHADTVVARLKQAVPHAAGVSVGIAFWDGVDDPVELLRQADEALYADKALGREARLHDAARLEAVEHARKDAEADAGGLDRLTDTVAELLDVPVALVSLVDDERQHFVGLTGLGGWAGEARGTALSHSFCQHTVTTGRALIVGDAEHHPAVHDNPAIEDLGVRAYAGVPLTTPDGHTLGALCAIDDHARTWDEDDVATLEAIAARLAGKLGTRAGAPAPTGEPRA
jgi:diguanylate cyclase (GGDEF)-like protein/PAS domain S-box-containing protein